MKMIYIVNGQKTESSILAQNYARAVGGKVVGRTEQEWKNQGVDIDRTPTIQPLTQNA